MPQLLGRFAALSLTGTILLSLLPSGAVRRTAAFAAGLLTLLCWAEGIASLLDIHFDLQQPVSVLSPTAASLEEAAAAAVEALDSRWEGTP